MRRLLIMGLMVFALFALAACGGDGDTTDSPTRGTQETPATQNNTTQPSNDRELALDTMFQVFGEGSRVVEATFHSNFSIVTFDHSETIHRIVDGEQVSDRVSEFIKFPTTVSNPSELQYGARGFIVLTPYADQVAILNSNAIQRDASLSPFSVHTVQRHIIQRAYDENYVDFSPVPPGETIESYVLIPFVGDGNYVFLFENGNRFINVLVTR